MVVPDARAPEHTQPCDRRARRNCARRDLAACLFSAGVACACGRPLVTSRPDPAEHQRRLRQSGAAPDAGARGFQSASADTSSADVAGLGPHTPVETENDLRQALLRRSNVGFYQGASLKPCWPLDVPEDKAIVIACYGGTLDLRCAGAGAVLAKGATLSLVQCNVLWPTQEPFFSASMRKSAAMSLADDSTLRLDGGSSALLCSVRAGRCRAATKHTHSTV
jgi:hypothetical protein